MSARIINQNLIPKVSVIVPIYNCEKYLKTCLDSIIKQTYSNLEIILVNDGSTDNSLQICNQIQDQDKRVQVINQKNQGTSAAKNAGLEVASGQYLTFVDADDWYPDSHSIELLYAMIENQHSEIAVGNFNEFDANTGKFLIHVFANTHPIINFTPQDWFKNEYSDQEAISQCFSTPWGKLFKVSLFNNLRFPVGKIDEDDLTMWKVFLKANQISYFNMPIYVYRNNRTGSITNVANDAQLFSIPAVEQRITMEKVINFDNIIKTNAPFFIWRLQKHRNNALKVAELANYKNAQLKLNILNKYNHTFY